MEDAQPDRDVPGLLHIALRSVLEHCVLPRLPAVDLGRLACCCKELFGVVMGADVRTWQAATQDSLHRTHPALYSQAEGAVPAALRRQALAHRSIATGSSTSSTISGAYCPQLSPCGTMLAVIVLRGSEIFLQVWDTHSSALKTEICLGMLAEMNVLLLWASHQLRWSGDCTRITILQRDMHKAFKLYVVTWQIGAVHTTFQQQLDNGQSCAGLSCHGGHLALVDLRSCTLQLLQVAARLQVILTLEFNPLPNALRDSTRFFWHPSIDSMFTLAEACKQGFRMRMQRCGIAIGTVYGPVHKEAFDCATWSAPDGDLVAYAMSKLWTPQCECLVKVISFLTGSPLWTMPLQSSLCYLRSMALSSLRGHLTLRTADDLQIWHMVSRQLVLEAAHVHNPSIAWSPNGRALALYDSSKGTKLRPQQSAMPAVWSVPYTPEMLLVDMFWGPTGTSLVYHQLHLGADPDVQQSHVVLVDFAEAKNRTLARVPGCESISVLKAPDI